MSSRFPALILVAAAVLVRAVVADEAKPIPPILTIRGTVKLPDGSIAKDAVLEPSTDPLTNDVISATVHDGQFEIQTTATTFNSAGHLLRTADGNYQTAIRLSDHFLRPKCLQPFDVVLEPTKIVKVHVTHNQKPVTDGTVQLFTTEFCEYKSKTVESGIAEFKIPKLSGIWFIQAWTSDFRVGGFSVGGDRSNTDFTVGISRGKPFRVNAVDANQNPVANVPLEIFVRGEGGENYSNPTTFLSTDADGKALFKWIPHATNNNIYLHIPDKTNWRIANREEDEKYQPDGSRLIKVSPSRARESVLVSGTVTGATSDLTGLMIVIWGLEGEERNLSDVHYARCDAQGHFAARLLPGCNYDIYADDLELVTEFWGGIPVPANGGAINAPQLNLVPTVPVTIHVTSEPGRTPVSRAFLNFEIPGKYSGQRRFHAEADAKGQFVAHLAAGKAKISAYSAGWTEQTNIKVVAGEPMLVELHHKPEIRKPVRGKLLLPDDFPADHAPLSVKLSATDEESKGEATVAADKQGNFFAEISAERIAAVVTSADQDFFGYGIFDLRTGEVEVPIHPTVALEGQLLNSEQVPVAGADVRIYAELIDPANVAKPGTPEFERRRVYLINSRTMKTDDNGRFTFLNTPRRMEFSLTFTEPNESHESLHRKDSINGDDPQVPRVYRLDAPADRAAQVKGPLDKWFADVQNTCRLTKARLLLSIRGSGNIVSPFTVNHVYDPQANPSINSYIYLLGFDHQYVSMPGYQEYFAAHDWLVPEKNSLFMAVLDETGKELGRETFILGNHDASAKQVAAFLDKYKLPEQDAKAELAAAIAEAKKSNRRIWVHVSHTRGQQFLRVTRWLDAHRELLSRDYVLFSFNDQRDLHSEELRKVWNIEGNDRPFNGILDTDGNLLISIGNSLESPKDPNEQMEQFRQMIKSTAKNLTDQDLEQLMITWPTK